jgi:bifunctional non-homologous end joining protein LigD
VVAEVVVEVKFNEWTADNRLRQPIFLGARDDKDAREVTREAASVQRGRVTEPASSTRGAAASARTPAKRASARRRSGRRSAPPSAANRCIGRVLEAELDAAEREGRDAHLTLGRDAALTLSSLDKVWFPGRAGGYTKGDVSATTFAWHR